MKILIVDGTLCDTYNGLFKKADILVEDGIITEIGRINRKSAKNAKVIDAGEKLVTPGLIDMHTHLREPGREDEETIKSGTRAAAAGGFTTICAMPNTQPVIDSVSGVKFVLATAREEGVVRVLPVGTITKGQNGLELSPIGKMKQAGVCAISDDGKPVMNSMIMRRALEYSRMFDLPVISHCEDLNLSFDGDINEGFVATSLGLKGIPKQSEEIMVARDIALANLSGGRLHIAHVSTARSVELIRQAKKNGIKVTAETAPHYFSLTDIEVKKSDYNTNTKMNPPLRTESDVRAIIRGLADGTIDCIASDHAPHLAEEKAQEFKLAPFGIIGMETVLPLIFTKLVKTKELSIGDAIAKLTSGPASVLNLSVAGLSKGATADITVIDPDKTMRIEKFESKCKNSPFLGMELSGFAAVTIVAGKIVFNRDGSY